MVGLPVLWSVHARQKPHQQWQPVPDFVEREVLCMTGWTNTKKCPAEMPLEETPFGYYIFLSPHDHPEHACSQRL